MLHNRGITGGQIESRVLIRAATAVDQHGEVSPAALLLEGDRIVQVGTPQAVGDVPGARMIDARHEVVLPGLVNAHAHLDLSGPGPMPYCGDFEQWLEAVLEIRWGSTPGDITAAVQRGVELSLAGGTALIGDISGMPHDPQFEALKASPLGGVSFQEFFGIGDAQQQTVADMDRALATLDDAGEKLACGLSPHAPYTCGKEVIQAAVRRDVPVAIHVSESPEELEFLETGTGTFRQLSEHLKAWNDGVVIPNIHPVDFVAAQLAHGDEGVSASQVLFVHLNYIEPQHLDVLADAGVTAVYCPRASAYFGHPITGEHPYLAMLDRGIPVALGTDSLLCLDTPDRISILDEMRFLYRRDSTPPQVLMHMATGNGAQGLGFGDRGLFDFKAESTTAGIMAVKADCQLPRFVDILQSDAPPRWLLAPRSWEARDRSSTREHDPAWCAPVVGA